MTHPLQPPRARTMVHPGPVGPVRIKAEKTSKGRSFRFSLMPGTTLFDGLVEPLSKLNAVSASTTILGGWFIGLQYCVAPPDPSGKAVATYSEPRHTDKIFMVFGNATIGFGEDGKRLVHCHAALSDDNGDVRGGHVLPQTAVVADQPISVLLTALDGIELNLVHDSETNMSILMPRRPM
jgi:predicted DNA-binding protein with PD1-like motif